MSSEQAVVLILALLVALLVLGGVLLVSRRQPPRTPPAAPTPMADPAVQSGGVRAEVEVHPTVHEPALRPAPPQVVQLRPLEPETRRHYLEAWDGVQTLFLDSPVLALSAADALLTQLLAERGLPVEERADRPLSAAHAQLLHAFRAGHEVEQQNTTENADDAQVQQGMAHFRMVFEAMIMGDDDESYPVPGTTANAGRHENR